MGLVAGAVYRELEFGLCFVLHRVWYCFARFAWYVEAGFDDAAAVETPHGPVDFVHQIEFEEALGGEFAGEGFFDLIVERLFAGSDEVLTGVQTMGGCVFGGCGMTGFGAGSGGGLGVDGVGCDLRCC